MVIVLAIFSAGCDNFGLDKQLFLKEVMLSLY